MTGTAFFATGADVLEFDVEAAAAQARREFFILLDGPDSEHALFLESRVCGGYPAVVIESGVVRGGECSGAIVHVEKDGIELAGMRMENDGNVGNLDTDAFIVKGIF